jgi:hypothetical protein
MSYHILSTLQTKNEQLQNGFFQSGTGPEVVLILGSCRTLAYTNYLVRWNETIGQNALTICRIDPFDWHWYFDGSSRDIEQAIRECEGNENILRLLRRTSIFIHEHYQYFGMFNTSPSAEKNIYQFGMAPRVNVCFPNFHDVFVLFNEQVMFDSELRRRLNDSPMKRLVFFQNMRASGMAALEKFYSVCRLSDFPEMEQEMRDNWTKRRFFWTGNHVSKHFTSYLFRCMNERFLHLHTDDEFWRGVDSEDQFSRPCTAVTQYDVDAYGLTWEETPIEPLKL